MTLLPLQKFIKFIGLLNSVRQGDAAGVGGSAPCCDRFAAVVGTSQRTG